MSQSDTHPINHEYIYYPFGSYKCTFNGHHHTHFNLRSVVTASSYFVVGFAVKKGGALRLNCIG